MKPSQTRNQPNDPLTLRQFIQQANPKFKFYRHIEKLIAVLQRVADGELTRLMVFMPPRHGKSETVSRLFTAYCLYRFPDRWVAITSYAAELAFTLSRNARENYESGGGTVGDTFAVKHWETGQGGGLWATGVGGPATGKGFHFGIIDDPLKNSEEAGSETVREKQKDWYRSTFSTREEPGGAIIVVLTRWHEDDLAGWLLSQEGGEDDEPERWHIVNMPGIAEAPQTFPATCTVESDERQAGEALCPERYPLAKLHKIRRRIGSYFWAALYQGRPQPLEGDMFKRSNFKIVPTCPNTPWRMRYWDKAASTSKSAKYSAGVRLSIAQDGGVYIEHVVRGQWETKDRRQVMLQTAQLDRQSFQGDTVIFIEQEPGSSGLDSVNDEIRMLSGFAAFADRPSGDKDTRMLPLSAQAQIGNLYLVADDWNEGFIHELCAIPNGRYRDQADATSGAFNRLVEIINAQPEGTMIHEETVSISPY